MTGLVRRATLLGVCGLLAATVVKADVPNSGFSTFGSWIFVGEKENPGNIPDRSIAYSVRVKNGSNVDIAGSDVLLNFQNCTDLGLCQVVVAGQTLDCPNRTVFSTTNASGQITFYVMGAGNTAPSPALHPGAGLNCMRAFASGQLMASATAVHIDLDGARTNNYVPTAVSGTDLGYLKDYLGQWGLDHANYRGCADYNCDTQLQSLDLAVWKDLSGHANNIPAGVPNSGKGCVDASSVVVPYAPPCN